MSKPHPLYERLPSSKRWGADDNEELFRVLTREALRLGAEATDDDKQADKDFAWRILARGIVVGVRRRGDMDMRRELRLARADVEPKRERWLEEVDGLLAQMGGERLNGVVPAGENHRSFVELPPTERDDGKTVIRLIELFTGETSPGAARCYRCWTLKKEFVAVPYVGGQGVHQACSEHAWAALGDAVDEGDRRKAQKGAGDV